MIIIAATTNEGKVKEIKKIFSSPELEIISMRDAGFDIEVMETGNTFEENALLKARAVFGLCAKPVLADDSGLCVDALDGAPGLYSARYAGIGASDDDKITKLLKALDGETNRKAHFQSTVAFIDSNGTEYTASGKVFGSITDKPCGSGGFGYDPVFFSDELQKTFGEATSDEKNSISHRARALGSLYEILKNKNIL